MSDPAHLMTLQRNREMMVEVNLRIKTELEEHARVLERLREELRVSEQMIARTSEELARAIGTDRNS